MMDDLSGETRVLRRVNSVQAARENGEGTSPGIDGAAMGGGVHPERETAHDCDAGPGQPRGKVLGRLLAVGARSACAYDRHAGFIRFGQVAQNVEHGRWIEDLGELA